MNGSLTQTIKGGLVNVPMKAFSGGYNFFSGKKHSSAFECKLKKHIFCQIFLQFCCSFFFFSFSVQKTLKLDFHLRLECAAPNCWAKYTTTVTSLFETPKLPIWFVEKQKRFTSLNNLLRVQCSLDKIHVLFFLLILKASNAIKKLE